MNSRTSILLAAIGLILPSLNPSAHAFGGPPGGPFSNGSYFPNDGTFSAVVRGVNLVGTMQFSTTAGAGPARQELINGADGAQELIDLDGGVGSTGVSTIFHNGTTYAGNSQGDTNPQNSTLNLTFQADAGGLGLQDVEVTTYVTQQSGGGISGNQTTFEKVPIRTILFRDANYLSGYANCKTSNAFPNQKFSGKGEIATQSIDFNNGNSDPVVVTSPPVAVSVTGVRLSNTASSFRTSPVSPPAVNTVTTFIETR
jgi:hypothetical protein